MLSSFIYVSRSKNLINYVAENFDIYNIHNITIKNYFD